MEQMTLFGEPVPIKQEMRYEEKIEASKVWEQLGKVYDVLTEWMRDKSE